MGLPETFLTPAALLRRRHEPLDLGAEGLDVADPHDVILARKLDEPRTGDSFCHIPPGFRRSDLVAASAEDERRNTDTRE